MCDGLLLAVFSRGKDREGGLASDRQTEPLHLTIFSPPSRALAHTHAGWHKGAGKLLPRLPMFWPKDVGHL